MARYAATKALVRCKGVASLKEELFTLDYVLYYVD